MCVAGGRVKIRADDSGTRAGASFSLDPALGPEARDLPPRPDPADRPHRGRGSEERGGRGAVPPERLAPDSSAPPARRETDDGSESPRPPTPPATTASHVASRVSAAAAVDNGDLGCLRKRLVDERARSEALQVQLSLALEVAAPAAIRYVIEEAARRVRLIVETAAGRPTDVAAGASGGPRPPAQLGQPDARSATGWWRAFVAAWDRDYPAWRDIVPPSLLRLASQRSGRGSLYSDLNERMHNMDPALACYIVGISEAPLSEFARRVPDLADVARVLPAHDPAIPTRHEARRASVGAAAPRRKADGPSPPSRARPPHPWSRDGTMAV